MPNWVQNKLVITGPADDISAVRYQLSRPYQAEYYDWQNGTYQTETVEGTFLLWNIIQPDNLDLYYQRAENEMRAKERQASKDAHPTAKSAEEVKASITAVLSEGLANFDMNEVQARFAFDVAFGQDWYHWNIRNWGTKWEISQDSVTFEQLAATAMQYEFATAWAPPAEALSKLAEQYPRLVMTLRCHDENDMFAAEIHWANGELTFDSDIDINHYLFEELYGCCMVCSYEEEDPDYRAHQLESMAHYGCPPKEA